MKPLQAVSSPSRSVSVRSLFYQAPALDPPAVAACLALLLLAAALAAIGPARHRRLH